MLALEAIKGLGPKRISALKGMGISNVDELLAFMPRAYKDMSNLKPIAALLDGEEAAVIARIVAPPSVMRVRSNMSLVRVMIEDESGRAQCVWFNQTYLVNTLKQGQTYLLFGRAVLERGRIKLTNPFCEPYDAAVGYDKILPIYPIKKSVLSQKMMRMAIKEALKLTNGQQTEFFSNRFRTRFNLSERNFAVENIHFPIDNDSLEIARRRLAFEELLLFQYSIKLYKGINKKLKGESLAVTQDMVKEFLALLPFNLTGAQLRTIEEIKNDLNSVNAMNRLVQGDVGSGKTVVALFAMFCAFKNNLQSALMVPTEILANQHFNEAQKLFSKLGIGIVLLTGGMKKSERVQALARIADGSANVIIGTHALFSADVEFARLGVVITDEQHRFGVRQRAAISAKGNVPDVLVMSATPIPRTLALILYGDLDISIIDELPPGRKKIKTFIIPEYKRKDMYKYLAGRIAEGRQGYFICPLVEETDEIEAVSAEELYAQLSKDVTFAPYKIGLVHGKLSNKEKTQTMSEFASGDVDVLVSTTVIEVGVNVPNAAFMVVEDASRFGLAQLHQLRGRIGRGQHESFCFLMTEDAEAVKDRLGIMSKTQNGFTIAEYDLELRGPGDFLGTRQHGLPDTKTASTLKNMSVVRETREAIELLDNSSDFVAEREKIQQYCKERNNNYLNEIAMN